MSSFCCGVCLWAKTQQPPVRPHNSDSLSLTGDSLKKGVDTLPTGADTLHPNSLHPSADSAQRIPDSAHRIPDSSQRIPDSLKRAVDSLLRVRDSLKKADSTRKADFVPSAAALLHQIDSANSVSAFSQASPVDSLKLRMDAMMAAAGNNQRSGGPPGMVNPQRQATGSIYSPAAGAESSPTVAGLPPGSNGNNGMISSGRPASGFPPPVHRVNRNAPPQLSNFHWKSIAVHRGRIAIDSLSVVPGTFVIKGIPDSAYLLDWVNGCLSWQHPPDGLDSVQVYYRTFPYKLNAVAKRFSYDSIENYFLVRPYDRVRDGSNGTDNFFNFGNIAYNGSFGRSITFGNSQDAVVTSNLNPAD